MVEAHAHRARFHVAVADDEHGVDFGFFGVRNLAFDWVGAEITFAADHVRAEFLDDGFRVIHQRFFVADGQDADLLGRESDREIARVMVDEEAG